MQPRIKQAFWVASAPRIQFFILQYPQVLLCRTAISPFIPQSVLILGIAPTQIQDLMLGLTEFHVVHTGPLLKPVQAPLDGHPVPPACTTQLGAILKLAEGALDPAAYVISEDIK